MMMHRYFLPVACCLLYVGPAAAVDPFDLKPGLVATYGDGKETLTRLEAIVGVTLATGESVHPKLGSLKEARWNGYINIVRGGPYVFSFTITGGLATISVNGKDVLTGQAGAASATTFTSSPVDLVGGVLPFAVTFKGDGGAARVELFWKGPGFEREPLPHMFFGHLPAERPAAFTSDAAVEHGRFRFEELACIRCHQPAKEDAVALTLADRPGPVLTDVSKRAFPGWMDKWLADPKSLRPNTSMPKLFTDDARGQAERFAVVKYLTSLGGELKPEAAPTISANYAKSQDSGRVLFGTVGCTACHQIPLPKKAARNDVDDEKLPLEPDDYVYGVGTATGPAGKYLLGPLGSKTTPEALSTFLKDPLKTHPAGRMPNLALESKDTQDIARYLCKQTDEAIEKSLPAAPKLKPETLLGTPTPKDLEAFARLPEDKQWAEAGKRLIVAKGCVNCHDVSSSGKKLDRVATFPTLAEIRKSPAKGCMVAGSTTAPDYKLEAREASAIAAFLKDGFTGAASKSPVHQARVAMKRFNCLNCHQRDGEGGLPVELMDQMKLLEKAEGSEDIRPPVLTGVGHKSRTTWLKGVLTEAQRARPWMALHMPQYGTANVGHLPTTLATMEGAVPDDTIHKVPLTPELITAGRQIVGKTGMGCISCHDISGIPNSGTRGPDLATIDQRVRYDWYERWLSQPLRMSPGTRMPQAFIDGKSPLTAVLKGDADAQSKAMWAYLQLGPGLPLPDGMEPPKGLTIVVKDRPEVIRTFLKEGGHRGIAVGFPGNVSMVFAADECRAAYAWAGNFLDATPVWDKRGGRPALLLGPKFWNAPPGHPWALTSPGEAPPNFDARASDPAFGVPLPVEPPRIYTGPRRTFFEGYELDKGGFPTFRYRSVAESGDVLSVVETPTSLKSGAATGLCRHFSVKTPAGRETWLNAGVTTKVPRVIDLQGAPVPLDLKAAAATVSVAGTRVILPAEGERVTVLELASAPEGTAWQFAPRATGGWSAIVKLPAASDASFSLNAWMLPKDDAALLKTLPGK